MAVITKDNWSAESRRALLDAVHDRWFDLDRVGFDQTRGEVRVCFGDRKEGPFKGELIFSGVSELEIEDEAEIQFYDIDDVRLDQTKTDIVLASGFPLRLRMRLGPEWRVSWDEPR
jgi:hypothetical protein